MRKEQEEAFWQTIKAFDEIGLLSHVMIIGSWAEYLFPPLFKTDFMPNLRTRDVDFFYRNINIPKEKINVVQKLKSIGYVYDEVDGISRFYKEDLLELEFLTRVLGAGTDGKVEIKPLGITSEGLRAINILSDFAREIESTATDGENYTLIIPEPSAYVIQKILTNPDREPREKRAKDISAVKELLYHIGKSTEHKIKFSEVYKRLSAEQLKIIKQVCEENQIVLP
ncbi:GSU2403 family nucleotidyltransferase fold protein [uncultured Treponema sp.]|uniref:GSU2403 family nucleotidyltransferase fold protein n=1 Tax=uncultured Treponema sp. TaxID=162155 RepID=UPI00261E2E43|nr:GSU2403 family nucleotidyltransferase fold protein [uncultured Treponema sp.]